MKIQFKQKGDFSKIINNLQKTRTAVKLSSLDKYGRQGVAALRLSTPIDTGQTANSWYYKIEKNEKGISLVFLNDEIQNDVPIAIILQYGHATRNGGWVQGRDYINPAVKPVFDQILNDVWREMN